MAASVFHRVTDHGAPASLLSRGVSRFSSLSLSLSLCRVRQRKFRASFIGDEIKLRRTREKFLDGF